jgi:hypothetical protein
MVGAQPISLALTGWLLARVGPDVTIWLLMLPQVGLALAATLYRAAADGRSECRPATGLSGTGDTAAPMRSV